MSERRRTPFRWALPVAELLLCAALVEPFAGFLIFQVRPASRADSTKAERPPALNLDLQRVQTLEEKRAGRLLMLRIWIPALLNLPCVFLGLARKELVPNGVFSELWRSFTWPIVGVIFWWIAGRGLEALLACRRRVLLPVITWIEVLVASLICMFCLLLLFGFLLDPDMRTGVIYPWYLVAPAGGLWVLLGAGTIAARIAQWRIRRQLIVDSKIVQA